MKVLIAATNASQRMGGEAALPLRHFTGLRRRGIDAYLITHARCRAEHQAMPAFEPARVFYIEDHPAEIAAHRSGQVLPAALREVLSLPMVHAISELRLARRVRSLARELDIDVIHQPIPVSPRAPSFLYDQPAPVVVGPMNGDMAYPPAFARQYGCGTPIVTRASRLMSPLLNTLFPGKTRAARLLAANERTRRALAQAFPKAKIDVLVDNGVDLAAWPRNDARPLPATPRFVFVGRLVRLKAVDILIDAFAHLPSPAELVVIGDGPEREALAVQARRIENGGKQVRFAGQLDHAAIRRELMAATALVLPSLREAGGAVLLEAMTSSVPVIATKWGGPEDYVADGTGFLVEPRDRGFMVAQIAGHMKRLARHPDMVREMGRRGRAHVEAQFSWEVKIDRMVEVYREVIDAEAARSASTVRV